MSQINESDNTTETEQPIEKALGAVLDTRYEQASRLSREIQQAFEHQEGAEQELCGALVPLYDEGCRQLTANGYEGFTLPVCLYLDEGLPRDFKERQELMWKGHDGGYAPPLEQHIGLVLQTGDRKLHAFWRKKDGAIDSGVLETDISTVMSWGQGDICVDPSGNICTEGYPVSKLDSAEPIRTYRYGGNSLLIPKGESPQFAELLAGNASEPEVALRLISASLQTSDISQDRKLGAPPLSEVGRIEQRATILEKITSKI